MSETCTILAKKCSKYIFLFRVFANWWIANNFFLLFQCRLSTSYFSSHIFSKSYVNTVKYVVLHLNRVHSFLPLRLGREASQAYNPARERWPHALGPLLFNENPHAACKFHWPAPHSTC